MDKDASVSPSNMLPLPMPKDTLTTTQKKKTKHLTIEDYWERNQAKFQAQHTPTYDENNEELDYFDNLSQDDFQTNTASASAASAEAASIADEPPPLIDNETCRMGPTLPYPLGTPCWTHRSCRLS